MAYRIIRKRNGIVSVASDDGSFFDINESELDFVPNVGDCVDVFFNGNARIVSKIQSPAYNTANTAYNAPGINSAGTNTTVFVSEPAGESTSKLIMIIVAVVIGLFVFIAIIAAIGSSGNGFVGGDDEYSRGYEAGFSTSGILNIVGEAEAIEGCVEAAKFQYQIDYGAPSTQSEFNHFNKYKENFVKGCRDGLYAGNR